MSGRAVHATTAPPPRLASPHLRYKDFIAFKEKRDRVRPLLSTPRSSQITARAGKIERRCAQNWRYLARNADIEALLMEKLAQHTDGTVQSLKRVFFPHQRGEEDYLTYSQFAQGLRGLNLQDVPEPLLKRCFRIYDRKREGRVRFKRFVRHFSAMQGRSKAGQARAPGGGASSRTCDSMRVNEAGQLTIVTHR